MTERIVHVVLVRWKDEVPDATLAELDSLVGGLAAAVPGVVDVAWGRSVSPEGLEAGFEWGLVLTFADAAARDGYLPHPAHRPVADIIGRWNADLAVFDVAA